MIFYLLYYGVESYPLSAADLEELLIQAREKNLSLDITGSLLYCEGTFIQLLEGPEDHVRSVFRSIEKDQRLLACKLIANDYIQQRYFSGWSMHYEEVAANTIKEMETYPIAEVSSYLKQSPAVKLLKLLNKNK